MECSGGFVHAEEKPIFSSLVDSAPEVNIIPDEEPDIGELPPPPPKALKAKGRAKIIDTQST